MTGPPKTLPRASSKASAKGDKTVRPALPPPLRIPGIVLARNIRGDSDVMATILTRENGLVTALAKNARQSVRRFGGGLLSPGAAAWYHLKRRPASPVWFLEKAEANSLAPILPSNPLGRALASWALELVRTFEARDNPAPESFNLLMRHLSDLSKLEDFSPPALSARCRSIAFAKLYLELAGFGPDLSACRACGRTSAASWLLDPLARGAVCPNCSPSGRGHVPAHVVEALSAISRHGDLPDFNEEFAIAAEGFFRKLATLEAGRTFKSPGVVSQLLSERISSPSPPAGQKPQDRDAANSGFASQSQASNAFEAEAVPSEGFETDIEAAESLGSDSLEPDATKPEGLKSYSGEYDSIGSDSIYSVTSDSDNPEPDGLESDGLESDGLESGSAKTDGLEPDGLKSRSGNPERLVGSPATSVLASSSDEVSAATAAETSSRLHLEQNVSERNGSGPSASGHSHSGHDDSSQIDYRHNDKFQLGSAQAYSEVDASRSNYFSQNAQKQAGSDLSDPELANPEITNPGPADPEIHDPGLGAPELTDPRLGDSEIGVSGDNVSELADPRAADRRASDQCSENQRIESPSASKERFPPKPRPEGDLGRI